MAAKKKQPLFPDKPAHPPKMCTTPGCPYDAKVRVGTLRMVERDGQRLTVRGSPWRDFCFSCADEERRKEGRAWCESQGLTTSDAVRARMRELVRDMLRRQGNPRRVVGRTREPGEDIEEAFV